MNSSDRDHSEEPTPGVGGQVRPRKSVAPTRSPGQPEQPPSYTDTFIRPCLLCGKTVHTVGGVEQEHAHHAVESDQESIAYAWWQGHDAATPSVSVSGAAREATEAQVQAAQKALEEWYDLWRRTLTAEAFTQFAAQPVADAVVAAGPVDAELAAVVAERDAAQAEAHLADEPGSGFPYVRQSDLRAILDADPAPEPQADSKPDQNGEVERATDLLDHLSGAVERAREQRNADNVPCHVCGGDRLRQNFKGDGGPCHTQFAPTEATQTTYATGHGFTPQGKFGNPDRCRVLLARYTCPYRREEHDPALPPEDVDFSGRHRPTPTTEATQTGADLIATERRRQVEQEGYTAEHDSMHAVGQFLSTAIVYLGGTQTGHIPWPVKRSQTSAAYHERDLVKAGALIAAAIDRLRTLATQTGGEFR